MNQLQNKMGYIIVEAIAPGLIMLLIGSLVFFMADVFYRSEHLLRMFWVLGFWIFGVVLVCRIAITEDHDRSLLSGIPLAIVTMIALQRFVVITGPLASVSFMINLGFIVFSWWCASRLVWDCTLVDSSRDTTNKGLLQRIPWRRFVEGDAERQDAAQPEANPEAETESEPDIFGATSEEDPETRQPDIWQRLIRMGRTPNTPGLTVVYFSLAAVPLFGLGQSFIPVEDELSRIFSMKMFVLFAIAALCLLLVTSLLALNQYLIKRGVTMPNPIAFSWLATGVGVILVVLAVAWMIPRPWQEYSWGSSPVSFVAPDDLESNEFAPFGNDGPDDKKSNKVNQDRESTGDQTRSDGKEKSQSGDNPKSNQETSGGKSDGKSGDKSKSDSKKSEESKSGEKQKSGKSEKQDKKSNSGEKSDEKQDGKQDDGKKNENNKSDSKDSTKTDQENKDNQSEQSENQSDQEENKSKSPDESKQDEGEKSDRKDDQQSKDSEKSEQDEASSPKPKKPKKSKFKFNFTLAHLFTILQWLFYLALLLVAGYFAWIYRKQIRESWRKFVQEMKELWQKWLGDQKTEQDLAQQSVEQSPQLSSFADFPNPFESGQATRMSREELVQYCFAAFEGWANDNRASRNSDQTPHEFARQISQRQPKLNRGAHLIADLYCQALYSETKLPVGTRQRLEQFWQQLKMHQIETAPPEVDLLSGLPSAV